MQVMQHVIKNNNIRKTASCLERDVFILYKTYSLVLINAKKTVTFYETCKP